MQLNRRLIWNRYQFVALAGLRSGGDFASILGCEHALNHCGTMTTPVAGYTDPLSNCLLSQGCDAAYPVYFCQHADPNYGTTNHGWPKFAANMTWQTFSKY